MRVPCLAWCPGTIAPGRVVQDLATEMDWFTTGLELAGARAPADRPSDGVSLVPVLRGTGPGSRDRVYYYVDTELMAVRRGPWKLHLKTIDPAAEQRRPQPHDPPLLFHLTSDPSERDNVAGQHPEVVRQLVEDIAAHRRDVKPGKPQL
jgi:arylsulfatase A